MSIPQLVVIVSYLVIACVQNIGAHLLWQIPESILVQQEILESKHNFHIGPFSTDTNIHGQVRAGPPRRSFEKFQAAIPGPCEILDQHIMQLICHQLPNMPTPSCRIVNILQIFVMHVMASSSAFFRKSNTLAWI